MRTAVTSAQHRRQAREHIACSGVKWRWHERESRRKRPWWRVSSSPFVLSSRRMIC